MASDNINVFVEALKKLSKKLNNRSVNDRLARKCRQIIYRRVKAGYGVNKDTASAESTFQVKLKPLSPSYIAYREGKVAFFTLKNGRVVPVNLAAYGRKNKVSFKPTLGEFGRPKKSNATLTGEMLKSLSLRYTEEGFQILIPGNVRSDDSGLTNKEVSQFYSVDRPFFALTAGEVRILTRELEKIVKEIIEREF
jgi:hypothetical protein